MTAPGTQWLLEHGGPVIRYRTARELLEDEMLTSELESELLASPLCKTWLNRLPRTMPEPTREKLGFSVTHGAADDKLETSLGKLGFLGFHRGIEPFDRRCTPLLHWLEKMLALKGDCTDLHPFTDFSLALVGSLLSLSDHADTDEVSAVIALRRDTIHSFVQEGRFDIYVPWDGKPPRFAKGRPLIDPQIYNGGAFRLPWHHDLHLFAGLPEHERNADPKIHSIIDYVLAPEFSSLLPEYGMIRVAPRRTMVSGWRPRLPNPGEMDSEGLLASLLMMAQFSVARQSAWFLAALDYLDSFRTGETYDLPKELIREQRPGYWPWNRMRLEERRTKSPHALESTFWVLKIRKLAGLF